MTLNGGSVKSDDAVRPILSAKRCGRQAKCSKCFPAFPEKVAFYILETGNDRYRKLEGHLGHDFRQDDFFALRLKLRIC